MCAGPPARSWLQKMQVAKKVLVDDPQGLPDLDALANAFIYLQARVKLPPYCFLPLLLLQQPLAACMQVL